MEDWQAHADRARLRYADGEQRLPGPDDPDARQRQLTRMGNAAGAAGLAALMLGRPDEAGDWFDRAATRYRESWDDAPAGSWGRPIGAIKSRLLAGDVEGAAGDARWALDAGAATSESAIGRYAATLALLVLDDWPRARVVAEGLQGRDDFPAEVADALAFLAAEDVVDYTESVEAVLRSFEQRDEYLEDMPVADTVIVLQGLARQRGMEIELSSPLLPD